MKVIAIGLNILLIITGLYFFITQKGTPEDEIVEKFLVFLIFAAPIVSVIALFLNRGENWIGLYFKRKAIEEKKKIEKLEG